MRCRTGDADGGARGVGLPSSFLLCVGYGTYLSFFPIGPVGAAYLSQVSGSWSLVMAAQACFLAFTGLAAFGMGRLGEGLQTRRPAVARAVAYVATLVGAAASYGGRWETGALLAGMALMGAASAVPKVAWYRGFLAAYRVEGRTRCIGLISACFAVAAVLSLVTAPLRGDAAASLAVEAALVAVAWMVQGIWERRRSDEGENAGSVGSSDKGYHKTPYSIAVLISFGITWTLIYNCVVDIAFVQSQLGQARVGVVVCGGAFCALAALVCVKTGLFERAHFGLLVRWAVVVAGCACAAMPIMAAQMPAGSGFALAVAFVFQSVVMILFSVDLCVEQGLSMALVFPVNFGIFIVASCLTSLAYWLVVVFADAVPRYEFVAFAATVASLGILPFLPSTSSRASSFTLDKLPENESYGGRVRSNFMLLAQRYDLSDREREVACLMLDGCSRDEIATVLSLSPWTVKTYAASAYKKLGVHSLREMAAKASGLEGEG